MMNDRIPAEAFPPAQGARLPWTAVPKGVKRALEDIVVTISDETVRGSQSSRFSI